MLASVVKSMPLWVPISLFGAFGGTAPTLIKLATALVAHPEQPMPLYAFYIGLALYALIGGVMAAALEQENLRGALFAGIAAPALISSAITGSQPAAPISGVAIDLPALLADSAHAAERPRNNTVPPISKAPAASPEQKTITIQAGTRGVPLAVKVCAFSKSNTGTAENNPKCAQQQTVVAAPNAPQTLFVPSDTQSISIGGKDVRLDPATHQVGVTVKSQPTPWQDFLWALGGARQAEVTSVNTSAAPAK